MKKICFTLSVFFCLVSVAQAHSVWINAFHATTHKPGHVMLSLGWGHALPMDDILNSPNGVLQVKTFTLIAPDMSRTDL